LEFQGNGGGVKGFRLENRRRFENRNAGLKTGSAHECAPYKYNAGSRSTRSRAAWIEG